MDRKWLNENGKQIVDSAYHVHKELGPGLLESAYERCFLVDLIKNGIHRKVNRFCLSA